MKPIRVLSKGKVRSQSIGSSSKKAQAKEKNLEQAVLDLNDIVRKYGKGKKDAQDLLEKTEKLEPKKKSKSGKD